MFQVSLSSDSFITFKESLSFAVLTSAADLDDSLFSFDCCNIIIIIIITAGDDNVLQFR